MNIPRSKMMNIPRSKMMNVAFFRLVVLACGIIRGFAQTPGTELAIYQNYQDGFASGTGSFVGTNCSTNINYVSFVQNTQGDYINIVTNQWHSGGYRMDCAEKVNNVCLSTCRPFPNPNFKQWQYLTMEVKMMKLGSCPPSVSLVKRWPMYSSSIITLGGEYVNGGSLIIGSWTRVVIPTARFATVEWPNVDGVKDLYFRNCASSSNPHYQVRGLFLSNNTIVLETSRPTERPTASPIAQVSSATHRKIHTNWYPILHPEREPSGHEWISATDNSWPSVAANVADRTVTVHIPRGQSVIYSGTDAIKYDKVIVEGSLTISPQGSDVSLTVATIVVEAGGSLDVVTDPTTSNNKVVIAIEGAIDQQVDPESTMLGILALGGNLTLIGNPVPVKMVALEYSFPAGSNLMTVSGDFTASFQVGGELVLPDTQRGLDVMHWNFVNSGTYVDQTETCIIQSMQFEASSGNTLIVCNEALRYVHSAGFHAGYTTRSIVVATTESSTDQGHVMHTAGGKFDVRNVRLERMGRTTTAMIDSTIMSPSTGYTFADPNLARMNVTKYGVNQIARYALHAHHSLCEAYFTGNALLYSPRDGCVAHNSRVHILDNVIVGADGTGVFLEDGTETGPVERNFIIGTGGGSRGGDDGRFSSQMGLDMAHGGFGIWCRGKLAMVRNNHAEGHFGFSPFAFFVHPNFVSTKVVPAVPGTPVFLVGKSLKDIGSMTSGGFHLQSYGGFKNNSAVATFKIGIDLSYFATSATDTVGSIVEGAKIRALAKSGHGISTTHSSLFTLNDVSIAGDFTVNTITGIWCNNCNGCTLRTPNTSLVISNVNKTRGGNC